MKKHFLLFVLMVLPLHIFADNAQVSFNIKNGQSPYYSVFANCPSSPIYSFSNWIINAEGKSVYSRYWPTETDKELSFLVIAPNVDDSQITKDDEFTHVVMDWDPQSPYFINVAQATSTLASSNNGEVDITMRPVINGICQISEINVFSSRDFGEDRMFIPDLKVIIPSKVEILFPISLDGEVSWKSTSLEIGKYTFNTEIPLTLIYDENYDLNNQPGGITTESTNILNNPINLTTASKAEIEVTIQQIVPTNWNNPTEKSLRSSTYTLSLSNSFQSQGQYSLNIRIYGMERIEIFPILLGELPEVIDVDGDVDRINTPSKHIKGTPTNYYLVDGRQTTTTQRGLNIVRMSDGTVKKIMKKK